MAEEIVIKSNLSSPVGTVVRFEGPGDKIPAGWISLENNKTVSRLIFRELFALIGTTYGNGDGVTTFGLPDPPHDHGQIWIIKF